MNISQALKRYPTIEADLLLGHVLKQSKEFLYMHPDKELSAAHIKQLQSLITQRKSGVPVAYLLDYKYFYGLKFKVNRNVLIPRPDSEWLVEEALKVLKNKSVNAGRKTLSVLDVGTGSGCIAISIAKHTNPKKSESIGY